MSSTMPAWPCRISSRSTAGKVATGEWAPAGRARYERWGKKRGPRAGGRGPRLTLRAALACGWRSRPPGVRGRSGKSASGRVGLSSEPHLDAHGLVAAVDLELDPVAGLVPVDQRAQRVDGADANAVGLHDDVAAERPGVAGDIIVKADGVRVGSVDALRALI